jgi:hypothetical protein
MLMEEVYLPTIIWSLCWAGAFTKTTSAGWVRMQDGWRMATDIVLFRSADAAKARLVALYERSLHFLTKVRVIGMFERFALSEMKMEQGHVRLRRGGSGPPVILLHGHPRTPMTWGGVADLLSDRLLVALVLLRAAG